LNKGFFPFIEKKGKILPITSPEKEVP